MLISKHWAVCKIETYNEFNPYSYPILFISKELFNSLYFFKPNKCDLIINNEKYEFETLPINDFSNNKKKMILPSSLDLFYETHSASIPLNIYHQLLGFRENQLLSIRTDVF
jgi:hypothetical protein